jgi:hypothetical protein
MKVTQAPWAWALIVAVPLVFVTRPAGQSATRRASPTSGKPRVVITADPELDDVNTLIRALLYSTDFTVEGLVYTSSGFHWKGDGKGTTLSVPGREYTRFGLNLCPCTSWRWAEGERFIDDIVETYAKAYPNLRVHNANYPSPALLTSKIRWGNVEFDGDYSRDTPGSDLIKSLLLDDRPGSLFVTAQGGQSTIARALKSIADQYSSAPSWVSIRQRVSRKLVIVAFGDQDGTAERYIKPNWPDAGTWPLEMVNFGYGLRSALSADNAGYVSAAWTGTNVSSRGPLGAMYRVWGDGKQMVKGDVFDYFGLSGLSADQLRSQGYVVWTPPQDKGSFISEGDTPTFLNLVDNGLRAYEHGDYGGWGGRRRADTDAARAGREAAVPPGTLLVHNAFFAAAQRDFAARLQWSVTPAYQGANHEPLVRIVGPLARSARAGETLELRGTVTDPDRDGVTVRWWHYRDAGTYPGQIVIGHPAAIDTTIQVPSDAQPGQAIHVILEATDKGTPSLTRYQRVIVTVQR